MNGILLRVGIDGTSKSGHWHAPCDQNGRFAYVPIKSDGGSDRGSCFDRSYSEFEIFAKQFGVEWPDNLRGNCHLDPDFCHLTYGDYDKKGKRIREALSTGDILVFWSGLRCIDTCQLICSIIGVYTVAEILQATDVGKLDWHRNAHTRFTPSNGHIVVYAEPEKSGRLKKHIRIGAYREGAQRVDSALLNEWGGLCTKNGGVWPDGYVQRGMPANFRNPEKFLRWFKAQKPQLIHANNI